MHKLTKPQHALPMDPYHCGHCCQKVAHVVRQVFLDYCSVVHVAMRASLVYPIPWEGTPSPLYMPP